MRVLFTFVGRIARERACDLLAACAEWQPDLLVRDETDFGSAIAAERLGIAHAAVLVVGTGSFVRHELVAEPLHGLRAEYARWSGSAPGAEHRPR